MSQPETNTTLINLALFIIFSSTVTFFAAELGGGLKKVWQRPWLRHWILLFLVSILVLMFKNQCTQLFIFLAQVWTYFLRDVFPGWTEGYWLGSVLLIIGLPFVPAFIVAGIYYAAQKTFIPYFWHIVWPLWVIVATFWLMTFTIHL